MMKGRLSEVGKYFNNHHIFSGVNLTLEPGKNYVILGGNGSGKSTLLKLMAGGIDPSQGQVTYFNNEKEIPYEKWPKHIAFCSPYMEIIEEFTFKELIEFQKKFKPFQELSTNEIIKISGLRGIEKKAIRLYSSGMKQRVKLCLTALSSASILFLDEPTSNLDQKGKDWYQTILNDFTKNKTVVVASNHVEEEYPENPNFIQLSDYKA